MARPSWLNRAPLPRSTTLEDLPIGYTARILTYIVTEERRLAGWPDTGRELFLCPRKQPKHSHLPQFSLSEMFEMKRRQVDVSKKDKKWRKSEDPFLKDMPEINRVLTDVWYEDGAPRLPGTMKIRFGVDQTAITLSDEDEEMSVTTTADTLVEAMVLLEAALANDQVRWRDWPEQFKRKNRKRG